ncbi:MAG: hypothetical protein P4L96_14265 [Rhodoferax sp.]|nr:hypothetical protein [Rhodoferax sp.]
MMNPSHGAPRRPALSAIVPAWLACALLLMAGASVAGGLEAVSPSVLRTRYAALGPELASNPFNGPLHLDSVETSQQSEGDIYAVVDYPFATVSTALNSPDRWCDVLILHLNTKYCRAKTQGATTQLDLRVGKKFDQPAADASQLVFAYRAVTVTPEYFDIELDAPSGPFGTSNYRILLEAVSIEGGRTFLHLGYAFGYGAVSHMALQAYLATVGRGKVGFTTLGVSQAGSQPTYIGGMRGLVERNTMRYYLAIDAYLGALSSAPANQLEKRLQSWFAATEKYPRQLHEMDRAAYLEMKRSEYQRQQVPP